MTYRRVLLVAALFLLAPAAYAADCEVTVEANDAMQYDTDRIEVSQSCDSFTITLKHVGSLGVQAMGHNWVLTKTADKQAVVNAGAEAGIDQGYLKANDDRVIAATDLIGGGKQTSVTFPVADLQADGDYTYFCSFPGHATMMTGTLAVVD